MSLFEHTRHIHVPRNVNKVHRDEQGVNTRIAVAITKATGTMFCAYLFAGLAILGFPALNLWLGPSVAIYVVWVSQTFLQLTFLPILSVGQSVLGRHQELQADEMFATTQKSYHDIEQIVRHLEAQDAELLKQTQMLLHLVQEMRG